MKQLVILAVLVVIVAGDLGAQEGAPIFLNPPTLTKPAGYTHIVISPDRRTAYIAGQVAFDSTGAVVGAGDFRAQTEQVFNNLRRALTAVNATFADVMKTTTYVTDVKQVAVIREIRGKFLDPDRPPANTLVAVASLARPELMIEIEAVVALPLNRSR